MELAEKMAKAGHAYDRGYYSEAEQLMADLIASPQGALKELTGVDDEIIKKQMRMNLGMIIAAQGRYEKASQKLLKSAKEMEESKNPRHIMEVYQALALLEIKRSDYKAAQEYLDKAKESPLYGESKSDVTINIMVTQGLLLAEKGDFDKSSETLQQTLELAEKAENAAFSYDVMIAFTKLHLYQTAAGIKASKTYQEVRDGLVKALDEEMVDPDSEQLPDSNHHYVAMLLQALAELEFDAGEYDKALKYLAKAMKDAAKTDRNFLVSELLRLKGEILLAQGKSDEAEEILEKAYQIAKKANYRIGRADALIKLAEMGVEPEYNIERARILYKGVYENHRVLAENPLFKKIDD